MTNTLRIAGTVEDSIVDGEGIRFTIFCQGCARRCPGCQNPETQPMTGGHAVTFDNLLKAIDKNPLLTGVTYSGGEPFEQAEALAALSLHIHEKGLNIWCYTGYTMEEITSGADKKKKALLAVVDVLVDGAYIEEERDLTLHFRGSRNQRIIDLKATHKKKDIVLLYED